MLALTVTATSGCRLTRKSYRPTDLMGLSSDTWRRSTVKPASVTFSAMSRALTEP